MMFRSCSNMLAVIQCFLTVAPELKKKSVILIFVGVESKYEYLNLD